MRLIDADFACKGCIRYRTSLPCEECVVNDAPTVDAVPVVRCRDCKHRGTDDCIFHIKGEPADEELLLKLDNDFCSYGERKEGANNGIHN